MLFGVARIYMRRLGISRAVSQNIKLRVETGNPIAPKTSKEAVSIGEGNRRRMEIEQRNARFNLWTPAGQKQVSELLGPIQAQIKDQGNIIRTLKTARKTASDQATNEEISEIKTLKKLKKQLERLERDLLHADDPFDRDQLDKTLRSRFFIAQTGEIYGGTAGFYDFGPAGAKLKNNIIQQWKRHFVSGNENVLELQSAIITPKRVFEASGHLQKFADYMVKDLVNGECFRADALISGHFNDLFRKSITPADRAEMDQTLLQMDSFTPRQLDEIIKKYKITSPVAKNDLSEPIPFNLMFQCQLGPEGKHVAYLRPETAQGVFINFNRLMQSANNRLPFAVAQIGHAFRNEIKPSQGVIRCREFELAEIQHFYDPKSAQFIDLSGLEKTVLPLWTSERQLNGSGVFALPLDEVIQEGVMTELVGYYLAKAFQFLLSIGIDQSKIRFREHLDHELAHYAWSCWDLECLTSHGWIECGGFAQRGCYDLQCHSSASSVPLFADRPLDEIRRERFHTAKINSKKLSKKDRKFIKSIRTTLESHSQSQLEQLANELADGQVVTIENVNFNSDSLQIEMVEKNVQVESFLPEVVEPSFGLGRIFAVLTEHTFRRREADGRRFFTFPPSVAPFKAAILTIVQNADFDSIVSKLKTDLSGISIDYKSDSGGKLIGRKYSMMDEIGANYCIVVDYDSIRHPFTTGWVFAHEIKYVGLKSKTGIPAGKPGVDLTCHHPFSVTIRDRDTLNQIRVEVDDVAPLIDQLVQGEISFETAEEKYLTQDEFLSNPNQMRRLEAIKSAQNGVKYSERDIGKLLSNMAEVAVQLDNPELLSYVHGFKRAMQDSR